MKRKPTLLQTILNQPSQSYTQEGQSQSNHQEALRVVSGTRGRSGNGAGAGRSGSVGPSSRRGEIHGIQVDVSLGSSSMEIQGSQAAHVSSSSHACPSAPLSSLSTPSSSTLPPPPPPKHQFVSEPVFLPTSSHNVTSTRDSASSRRGEVPRTHIKYSGIFYDEDEDDEDNDSTQDVFYTPNSSPRASLASSLSLPMSYTTAATTAAPRKINRRSLRNISLTQDPSPSSHTPNQNPNPNDQLIPELASPSSLASPINGKVSATNTPMNTNTNTDAAVTSAGTSSSPPLPSARVAVPSTRTPSRSNSLNKSRLAPGSRFEHGSATTRLATSEQAQGRSMATVSVVSDGSSMSSNSLDGHSVFSDLLTDTTLATTASTNGVVGTSRSANGFGSADEDTRRRRAVDRGTRDTLGARATITPTASTSQPRRRPTKSHTYHGLGVSATATTTTTSAFPNPNLYQQRPYQRSRDKQNVMMSMTAVLEAAEEEEMYRSGQSGGLGSAAWRAKQLLKQHKDDSRKASVVGRHDTVTGIGIGKGSLERNEGMTRGPRERNRAATLHVPFSSSSGGEHRERGRERRDHSSQYSKHQPITPSPLSASSKLGASSLTPTKQQFLQIPVPSRLRLGRRRSRSLGAESTPRTLRSDSPIPSGSRSPHIRSDSPARSHGRARSVNLSVGTAAAEVTALPKSSGELPSKGTAGYTSLVLPRAPPPLNLDSNRKLMKQGGMNAALGGFGGVVGASEGKVDLTKNGMAQTTMASVEVVRGLGGVAGRKGGLMGMLPLSLPLVRRRTLHAKTSIGKGGGGEDRAAFNGGGGESSSAPVDGSGCDGVLGFTSYRRPPEYVPSGGVLVQVWAVGVDGVDGRLVGVRMAHGASTSSITPAPAAAATSTSTGHDRGTGANNEPITVVKNEEDPTTRIGDEIRTEGNGVEPAKTKGSGLGRSLSLRQRLSRSVSLGRYAGKEIMQQHRQQQDSLDRQTTPPKASSQSQTEKQENYYTSTAPSVGYIPGRSFVGRVVECGWEVRGEVVRKGEWVAGLLDVKKCGALTEFIVVDRHRIHRVPHPQISFANDTLLPTFSPLTPSSASTVPLPHSLTLEELALIPLCGVPAYRAVRTFIYAFSSMRDNLSLPPAAGTLDMTKTRPAGAEPHTPLGLAAYGTMLSRLNLGDHENGRRRRALVLRGHDGIGAMAVQMLILRGWRVCVHVPFIASPPNVPTTSAIADRFMEEIEERIRKWGAEEVIFDDGEVVGTDEGRGAVVRVLEGLREDGDVFDAVLDTVGGKEVREAAERLLRSPGRKPTSDGNDGGRNGKNGVKGVGQFTTVVGDNPERAIPSAGDLFRAGLRSLKFGSGGGGGGGSGVAPSVNAEKASSENTNMQNGNGRGGKVGYAWVNISQDVDWEGKDVGETIGSVMDLALEYGIKPWVGAEFATANGVGADGRRIPSTITATSAESAADAVEERVDSSHWEGRRTVTFEKAPEIFVDNGPLSSGGTVVVKIAS